VRSLILETLQAGLDRVWAFWADAVGFDILTQRQGTLAVLVGSLLWVGLIQL